MKRRFVRETQATCEPIHSTHDHTVLVSISDSHGQLYVNSPIELLGMKLIFRPKKSIFLRNSTTHQFLEQFPIVLHLEPRESSPGHYIPFMIRFNIISPYSPKSTKWSPS